jgi:hypothetical protein
MEGSGGPWKRVGHFTFGNLSHILKNKAYIGVRVFEDLKGVPGEAPAAWDAIIDEDTFDKVQKRLKENHHKFKPASSSRYPYLLSSLVKCGSCQDSMAGKSAHGNGGKIGYYEHGWSMRRQACLVKKVFSCAPNRVLAKRLEPLVLEKVRELLSRPETARHLIQAALRIHKERAENPEAVRLRRKVQDLDAQLEALCGRLAELPSGISAQPIYKQMEKIERTKDETAQFLSQQELDAGGSSEMPAELKDFEAYLTGLGRLLRMENESSSAENPAQQDAVRKVLAKLVHKVEVLPEKVRIHFYAGKQHVERESPAGGSRFFKSPGSNSLTNGARERTRTSTPYGTGF